VAAPRKAFPFRNEQSGSALRVPVGRVHNAEPDFSVFTQAQY
jgi:hypothetical protein